MTIYILYAYYSGREEAIGFYSTIEKAQDARMTAARLYRATMPFFYIKHKELDEELK